MKYEKHDFYCISCGNKALNIMRSNGRMREKGHLKKLYCYNCKSVCNCYEIRDEKELKKFKNKFENGDFKEMAEQSLEFCKGE